MSRCYTRGHENEGNFRTSLRDWAFLLVCCPRVPPSLRSGATLGYSPAFPPGTSSSGLWPLVVVFSGRSFAQDNPVDGRIRALKEQKQILRAAYPMNADALMGPQACGARDDTREKEGLDFVLRVPMELRPWGYQCAAFKTTSLVTRFVLSHPCRDETTSWMGHPGPRGCAGKSVSFTLLTCALLR